MADHVRKQIRDAIAAVLTGLVTTGARVYPGRTWPMDPTKYPALLVYAHGGPSQFIATGATDADIALERQEDIIVEGVCRTAGEEPDDTLDLIAAEVEAAMMADTELAALIDRRELTQTDLITSATAEKREGSVKLTYRVTYCTPAGDATTRI